MLQSRRRHRLPQLGAPTMASCLPRRGRGRGECRRGARGARARVHREIPNPRRADARRGAAAAASRGRHGGGILLLI